MGAYRPQSISRTGGVVPTCGSRERRDEPLIATNSPYQDQRQQASDGHVPPTPCCRSESLALCHEDTTRGVPVSCPSLDTARRTPEDRSWARSGPEASADGGSARTTTSVPAGRSSRCAAIRWRNCLVTRCRTTEPPTERPTTKPARAGTAASVAKACTTTVRVAALEPARMTTRNSSARRILRRPGSTKGSAARPRCECDPCRDARRARHDPPACSCGCGTRAYGRADGCSAGKCASWRLILAAGCSRTKSLRRVHHWPHGPLPGY